MDWSGVKQRYDSIVNFLNEKTRRLFGGAEANALGPGGISFVSRETGMSRDTVRRGAAEARAGTDEYPGRIRKPGGGRKKETDKQPGLLDALRKLVEGYTHGDPESPLRYVAKSIDKITAAMRGQGFKVGRTLVWKLLREELKFSLKGNKKEIDGPQTPEKDQQISFIASEIERCKVSGEPILSVDAKKKELVGNYKNEGREWTPPGQPELVEIHDFEGELGKAKPYGVYDIKNNSGYVSVGLSADTAQFAVESIRRWFHSVGKQMYPDMKELNITADGGGSNGSRLRLWKIELQKLSDEIGVPINVRHYPPGMSKYNKIEHRLFSFISMNWRAQPLISYVMIICLIAATTTVKGLKVSCELDNNVYQTGIKVSDEELASVNLKQGEFFPLWNYTISPSRPSG